MNSTWCRSTMTVGELSWIAAAMADRKVSTVVRSRRPVMAISARPGPLGVMAISISCVVSLGDVR